MDERFIKKLVVPSCIIVILSTTFIYELKYLMDILFFKKKHILIIGILSSPINFQQRLSIRKTWLKLLSEISGSAYFIVGNEICEIPPYDRADPYSCEDRPFILPENVTAQTEFNTMKIQNFDFKSKVSIPSFIGFGFYVRNNIVVTKLGILRELLRVVNTEIQVKLFSAFDNKVLASVTFNSELLNGNTSLVITKAIRPVKLNKNFEAFIKLEIRNIANYFFPKCDFATWQTEPNIINFIQLWQENSVIPQPFTKKSCTFLFLTYTIEGQALNPLFKESRTQTLSILEILSHCKLVDPETIIHYAYNRTLRLKEWQRFNKKLAFKLENEIKIYNDILLVNVVDVYRNLSKKMIHFYKRILETEYFHYVLKADDDSFIDLLRVHEQLKVVNRELDYEISQTVGEIRKTGIIAKLRWSKFWWWSYFKEYWKVQRSGKWREDQYQSASYPTFPCGGGYVLSKGIVDYIAANNHHLYHFQGEDVSLGIWLSSLHVTHYKTPKIIGENSTNHLQEKIIKKFQGKRSWLLFKMNKTATKLATDLCEWTCSNKKYFNIPLCNKVQLSIQNMYATWKDYIREGYL